MMKIDLSIPISKKLLNEILDATENRVRHIEKAGHIGTHFDVMNKEFAIESAVTRGRLFDIRRITAGQVTSADLDLSAVQAKEFVMFYSGILKKYGYGTREYLASYIELSDELVDALIGRKVSLIGVDMAGIKGPKDHPRIDQHCADAGVFVIENLNNLDMIEDQAASKPFTVYTLPVNMTGLSGLPCRVVAEI